uniref:Uncharacterized protein n=1 Tax=viral metagenome TaxID=1070528 RepID=A0A6C0E8C0_9ZZZZ
MSKKVSKPIKTYSLQDLDPTELKTRLNVQNFFNSFDEYQNSEWKVLIDQLINLEVHSSTVYLEILYRLDINKLKNLSRYVEMSFKKTDQFPNQIRDIYEYSDLKSLLIKRWLELINEDIFKFFATLEEYFLPPKL